MANFCTNCGTKLEKDDNFCPNCGVKISKSDIKQDSPFLNQYSDSMEKKKAKKELERVVGGKLLYNKTFVNGLHENGLDIVNAGKAIRQQVEKEIESGQIKSGGVEFRVNQLISEYKIKNEEDKRKIKMIDEIFDSEEIKSEIMNSKVDQTRVISIKDSLKNRIIDKKENMGEEEIIDYIKKELIKASKEMEKAKIATEKEMVTNEEKNEMNHGGYCDLNCIHCCEEFLDSGGGIVGDFDAGGCVEYYCDLGHSASPGLFCEYYE